MRLWLNASTVLHAGGGDGLSHLPRKGRETLVRVQPRVLNCLNGAVAERLIATACKAVGRGFESHSHLQFLICGEASATEHTPVQPMAHPKGWDKVSITSDEIRALE